MDPQLLQTLAAAIAVRQTSPNHWELTTENAELLRKQLLELSLRHQLNIISLDSDSQSLEDVFRALTGG